MERKPSWMLDFQTKTIVIGADQGIGARQCGGSPRRDVSVRRIRGAGTQWGNKKYMNMKHLEAALDDAFTAG